jgi:hypothetical protein
LGLKGFAIRQRRAIVPDSAPKTLQRNLYPLSKAIFNSADKFMDTGKQTPTVFSLANEEIFKLLKMPNPVQTGKHPIKLFAFLRFLLAEDSMLILGSRGHN